MASTRLRKIFPFFRIRILLSLACVITVYFLFIYRQPLSEKKNLVSTFSSSEITPNWSYIGNFKNALRASSNGVFAARKVNRGKPTGSALCVVDPGITECANMGFAAFLLHTLDNIIVCNALGINRATIFWRACKSVCSRDPTFNSWDWYFESVNHGLETKVENVLCVLRSPIEITVPSLENKNRVHLKAVLDNSFQNRSDVDGFESSRLITTQERMRVNKLIEQYVKPNSRIKEKVRMFYQRYLAGFTVLGIHVRGTDHWRETSEKRLPSLMSWVKRARSILETLPRPRKIFIASDDEVIKRFVAYFGKEMVVFTEAVRAKRYYDQIAPHDIEFEHNAAEPHERELGTQVLMDILLLAKCDHFLHTESSVASLASYFNPHMTSYFLQDDKKRAKKQKNSRETREKQKQEKQEQGRPDEIDDLPELLKCFQRNSAGSVCPNIAKGVFVSLEEVQLRHFRNV